jgi:hypothetical protein
MPSRPSINKKALKLIEKGINERFDVYFEATGHKMMSQILDIEDTYDINVLFKEFVKQYVYLWNLRSEDEVDELHEKFVERLKYVVNTHYPKEAELLKDNEKSL